MPAPFRLILLAPLAAFALSGCGQKDDGKTAQAAGGEVLPGTVSDAMIDLDTSTATPPLQPVQSTGAARTASAPTGDASGAPDEAALPPQAPAETAPAPAAPAAPPG